MGSAGETLYLVRTQGFGPMARLLAQRLAATGVQVAAVVDERLGKADTKPFEKITLSETQLASMGLSNLPRDWGWLCGDLCYFIAAQERPGFKFYALIESDVFLPETSAAPVVKALGAHPAEAIAAQLGPSKEIRRFSSGLSRFGLDPGWGCIFPFSRVTSQVIEEMRKLRGEQLRDAPKARLNDEAILAGAILRGGFSYARLEDVVPNHVEPGTFNTNPPHLFEAVAADPDERRLFHPVVPFDLIIKRLRTGDKAYSHSRLRNVLRTAPRPMRMAILRILRRRAMREGKQKSEPTQDERTRSGSRPETVNPRS